MPNIAKVLKDEIARIAKRQARAFAGPLKKHAVALRHDVADLKRVVAGLQKDNARLVKEAEARALAKPQVPEEKVRRMWVFAKGVRSMRKKLGLSQAEFAKLIGVSAQAVTLWENKDGKLDLRNSTKEAILGIRSLGAREARRRLDAMGVVKARRGRRPAATPAPRKPRKKTPEAK